ncbi:hypothetical protein [Actinoplanes sp. NPDC051851]|uniref:hypothetical protein n=1 Tax=Actinoplanes sp. NPDC051851 TaxID=3154753 RepID=UPI0034230536
MGVEVSAEFDLRGLRGEPISLFWSVVRPNGGERLSGRWRDHNLGFQLLPGSDHATGSKSFWVPLPKSRNGSFIIQASLMAKGAVALASAETEEFS